MDLLLCLEHRVVATVLEYVEPEEAPALIVELLASMEQEYAAQRPQPA